MRYFKYKGSQTTEAPALRAQYAEYQKKEERLKHRDATLGGIGCGLFLLVTGACFGFSVWGLTRIPEPEGNVFLMIAYMLGIAILGMIGMILSIVIGLLISVPIWKRANRRTISRQDILSKACEHLREYYGLQDPCIVTKCFASSDEKFKNHDVCIFVADEELRITTNLKNGLSREEKDLGCHAFLRDEITLTKIEGEKFLIAELKAGETTFLFGYRAKGFIEKNFLFKESDTQTQ